VLADADAAEALGIDASIFVAPEQLHLTVVMLKLYSAERRAAAQKLLLGLQPQVQELLAGQALQVGGRAGAQAQGRRAAMVGLRC
jgi:hypothetical protein